MHTHIHKTPHNHMRMNRRYFECCKPFKLFYYSLFFVTDTNCILEYIPWAHEKKNLTLLLQMSYHSVLPVLSILEGLSFISCYLYCNKYVKVDRWYLRWRVAHLPTYSKFLPINYSELFSWFVFGCFVLFFNTNVENLLWCSPEKEDMWQFFSLHAERFLLWLYHCERKLYIL